MLLFAPTKIWVSCFKCCAHLSQNDQSLWWIIYEWWVVQEWWRQFNESWTNIHDIGGNVWKSVATDDQMVWGKQRFAVCELSEEFPELSQSAFCTIVISKYQWYQKLFAHWVSTILTDNYKTQHIVFMFLTHYNKSKDFLIFIFTGHDMLVVNDNPVTKKQSKQWIHSDSPSKPERCKQLLNKKKTVATRLLGTKKFLVYLL